jgi:hypothetical protein
VFKSIGHSFGEQLSSKPCHDLPATSTGGAHAVAMLPKMDVCTNKDAHPENLKFSIVFNSAVKAPMTYIYIDVMLGPEGMHNFCVCYLHHYST